MTGVERSVLRPAPRRLPLSERSDISLPALLDLEAVEDGLFRATTLFEEPFTLYGGQAAAQALVAAGRTVDADRTPHSLHGYFIRAGDASRPTVFRVERDRDGRSYSARRVVALQKGELVFSMSVSFQRAEEGLDRQVASVLDVPPADGSVPGPSSRLFSFETRLPPQPYPESHWPTRLWARCTAPLGDDPRLHTAALTYISDALSGLAPLGNEQWSPMGSLDHALWIHRPVRMDEWVLLDLVPRSTAGGRGWYTGTVSSADGVLLASLAQEQLFRRRGGSAARSV